MTILNIETATEVCSIAISDENKLLALEESIEPYAHSQQITQLINTALQKAKITLIEIDAIALSHGPGSYTGLRVGASTAKGICYALKKPLIAINTLAAMAGAAQEELQLDKDTLYCPMIDARRMEVYTALFSDTGQEIEEVHNKIIDKNSFQDYFKEGKTIVFSGNGAAKIKDLMQSPFARFFDQSCSAKFLIKPAIHAYENKLFEDTGYYEPLYFKTPNITKPKKLL